MRERNDFSFEKDIEQLYSTIKIPPNIINS